MSTATENSFGNLLRSYRRAAGLSQEELAERANLSARTISDLERGLKAVPHRETVRLLGEALDLTPDDLARFDGSISRRRGQRPDASSAEDVRLSGHLPVPPTPMIGREREQAEVMRLLRQERVRLLTLTGPPGVGKTRLGLAVAAELTDAYAGGVVFVNLVPLRDAGLVGATIAHALGLQEARGQSATEVLTAYLRRKHMLLVLDNFEHLLEAATLVGELLAACPDLSVLVTSRWALEMRAEYLFEVPVLACPPLEQALSDENAIAYPAVQLFVERARAVQQDFRLHADIVPAVTRICRRLDGLPLAIELAAPWTRVLSPMALQTRLEHHVLALVADARDRAGRHRTLRDTLAWSYELLEVEEQRLLPRLGVFLGGSSLEAIEAICCMDGRIDAIRVIASLVNKSLVHVETDATGERRFVLLEMVREYALERLDESGESEAFQRAHAAYYLDLALRAEPELRGPRQGTWFTSLDLEHDNLRAALQWALDKNELLLGLRAAGALWRFWWVRGHLVEGLRWLRGLLHASPADAADDKAYAMARAEALRGAGVLACYQGDFEQGRALLEESLATHRQLDNAVGVAGALVGLGNVHQWLGDTERAGALLEEGVTLYRHIVDALNLPEALASLGTFLLQQRKWERAKEALEESLRLYQQNGDAFGRAHTLMLLGEVARAQGQLERAMGFSQESLQVHRTLGNRAPLPTLLTNLGLIALVKGELDEAERLVAEGLALAWELNDRWTLTYGLEGVALTTAEKNAQRSAQLLGAAAALREAIHAPLPDYERAVYDPIVAALQASLGQQSYAEAWAIGRSLPLEQIVAMAHVA